MRALRNRDWAAIAIDLAVVTLGILLAFQIDQWGQDRRQAKQERQFLERMWRETDDAIRENDWVLSIHARTRQNITRAFNARTDPKALAKMGATRGFSGCGADSMIGLGYNDTSYQELSSSGDLNLVSDPDLRAELRAVAAAQADAIAQLDFARQRSIAVRAAIGRYEILDLDRRGNRSCRMDWPALMRDPIARMYIILASRDHLLMWWKRAYTRDVLSRAHNRIACKLAKSDCLDAAPQIVGRRNLNDRLPADLQRKFDETAANLNLPE